MGCSAEESPRGSRNHPSLCASSLSSLPIPSVSPSFTAALRDSIQGLGGCHAKLLSCIQLCNTMDGSPPHSSVRGILQARMLGWVAIPSARASFQPRNRTGVFCTAGRFLTSWATREAWLGGHQTLKAKNRLTLEECIHPDGKSSRSWSSQVPQASFPMQQVALFWGGWRWQPEAILQD